MHNDMKKTSPVIDVYVCVLVAGDDFVVFFPRFIRGKVSFADQSEREAPPKGSSVVNMLYGSKPLRDAYSNIVKLYENFVGPVHFRAMSRLLGYQGIAMILEQLLHILDGQVGEHLCVCVCVCAAVTLLWFRGCTSS